MIPILQAVCVTVFGCLLGATELLSRYRDAPLRVLQARAAILYIAFNGLIALASLYLIKTLGLVPEGTTHRSVIEAIVAGFGGAAFFRSSIARTRVGDVDVGVGPSFAIETLLGVTDREIDRWRAEQRALLVTPAMADLPVAFVTTALVPYCLNLMQNLSAQERQDIETRIDSLITKKVDEDVKPFIFGLMLVNVVGLEVLVQSKKSLAALIEKKKKRELEEIPSEQKLREFIEKAGASDPGQPPSPGPASGGG